MGNLKDQDHELPPNVERSIQGICKREGFLSYDLKCELISTNGGSFLGKLYLVAVAGVTKDGEKKTNIFVKSIIPCEKLGSTLNLPAAYATEAFVYNELSKIFAELQKEAGIPLQDRFKMIKSYGESDSKALILENLQVKGYKSCDRHYVMDVNVAKLGLEQLAKFHALSLVFEKKRPEEFARKIKNMTIPFTFNDEWITSAENIANIAKEHVSEESKKKLEKFMSEFAAKWQRYIQPSGTKCCLCHGDFRLNNLLMKEINGEVAEVIMHDFQLAYYGCPINDILFYIYLGTDHEFRQKNLEHLKKFYFDIFADFLAQFSLDVESIYPRRDFEKDFEERKDYGLLCAMYFMPFFLAAEGDVPDLGEESIQEMHFNVHETFPVRMQGIVDDFVEWGFL